MSLDEDLQFRQIPRTDFASVPNAASFHEWTGSRAVKVLSTNAGAPPLPFQQWKKFKEAFSPELVEMAVVQSARTVKRLCDPFGGSGTSALAAQFLNVESISIEVNPFLSDLINAKVHKYDLGELLSALPRVMRRASRKAPSEKAFFDSLPPTFIEPGRNGRWLFDEAVAKEIFRLQASIECEDDASVRRLFNIILGGMLVDFSNAVVSGKGRRYRSGWESRRANPADFVVAFSECIAKAIIEIDAHSDRPFPVTKVLQGDCRSRIEEVGNVDLVVCSPPYPNSFDYTDVYNIELWMLGYLKSSAENAALRRSTLSSHVQISRAFSLAPPSPTLENALRSMSRISEKLWDVNLVSMVGGYFADMSQLLEGCKKILCQNGQIWLVVGDSQYAGVRVDVAQILTELGAELGLKTVKKQPFRSMRLSPQQGGAHGLAETLVVLQKA